MTSNGFKEILTLNDRTKAECKAIAKREAQILEDKMFTVLEEQTSRINQMAERALSFQQPAQSQSSDLQTSKFTLKLQSLET